MTWTSRFARKLQEKASEILAADRARRGLPAGPMEGWTIHNIRHAVATHMVEDVGVSREVVALILGHRQAGPSATKIYDRSERLADRRAALVAWAAWLERVVRARVGAATVVPLRRASTSEDVR